MSTYYVMGRSPLALPLGELSPQVTERVLQPFSNEKIDLCAHTTKISVDIPVGESQNIQPKRHQELRTFGIISKPLRFIMLRAIQFNDQSGRSTVKVHDESADDPLFVNFYWISAEKKIPELTLVGCHLPAKPPGIFQLGIVFWYCHCLPSPPSLHSATSPIGRGKGCLHGCCFTTTRLCVSFFFAKSGVILKKYFQNPMQPVNCFWIAEVSAQNGFGGNGTTRYWISESIGIWDMDDLGVNFEYEADPSYNVDTLNEALRERQ